MEMIDPIYETVDDKRAASFSRKCSDADYVITNETYSAMKDVTSEDAKTKELYPAMKKLTREDNARANKINIKLCACASITILLLFVLIAVAFTMIFKLKSEADTSTFSLYHLITELNESISSVSLGLNQDLNESVSLRLNLDLAELSQKLKENITSELIQNISALYNTLTYLFQGKSQVLPAPSCAAILHDNPSSPSGYYWITPSNNSTVRVYCDMIRSCGNITGGWTRVASLNMKDSSTQCPSGLKEKIFDDTTIRSCVNRNTSRSCSSDKFSTYNLPYSSVCGQIRAYQFGSTDAFNTTMDIESYYLDGISLTHGSPRQHIWTFVAALDEVTPYTTTVCPCFNIPGNVFSPSFVEDDYFCDTGSSGHYKHIFYSDDPLWDGEGCEGTNMCCSFNNPPWFYKSLSQATIDDIEVRVCRDEESNMEDVAVELIEIYIQ